MSATPEMSHSTIGPCEPLEQSPSGDSSIHALTASLSSVLEFGENAAVGWRQSSRPTCKVGRGRTEGWHREVRLYIVLGRVRVMPKLGIYTCARTIARIRQHADKEHYEHDPKMPK